MLRSWGRSYKSTTAWPRSNQIRGRGLRSSSQQPNRKACGVNRPAEALAFAILPSTGFLPPSLKAEKAIARQDQAGKGRAGQLSCPCPLQAFGCGTLFTRRPYGMCRPGRNSCTPHGTCPNGQMRQYFYCSRRGQQGLD